MQPALATYSEAPFPDPDETLSIEAVWDSAYEQLVRPDKAIVLNAYFFRHLQLLGPELGWMYVAFRQAAYSAGGREGQRSARFTGKAIAALSGSTERTFWNRAAKPETWQKLAGLVTLVDEKPLWNNNSATPKRLPLRYLVAMTLPLTGPDASALRDWLLGNKEQCQGAAGVLAAACQVPVAELLAQEGQPGAPITVQALVRELFSCDLPGKELNALAERLQQHIQPSHDLLFLKHFFVERILPQLGAGPGWLLSILRDRCWQDRHSGESRSQVTVQGGYAEMAGWLGLSRAKTIWEWLRDPVLQIYIRHIQAGQPETSQWDSWRSFEILQEEVPLEIVQACIRQMHVLNETSGALFSIGMGDRSADSGAFFSIGDDANGALYIGESGDFAAFSGADFSIGVARFSGSDGANFSMAMARISQFSGAIFRVFKLLSSLKLLKQMAPPEKPPEAPKELGADAPVCDLENPKPEETVEEPQTPKAQDVAPETEQEPRVAAFPEDVRQAAVLFAAAFGLVIPEQPAQGEKGGDFALWIKGLRKLNQIAADYGAPIEKAIQATHEYWNNRPFTVSHPLAIKSTMQSVLSRKKAVSSAPAQLAAAATASYDPAQRRKEISSALGFDIDQPLTAEQQTALQAHLDSLLAQLPKNPLKS